MSFRDRLMDESGVRSGTVIAVAILLGGCVLAQHALWLEMHTAVETWDDDAGLFRLALCFWGNVESTCSVGAPYPPLVPWVSSWLMGDSPTLAHALSSLWPFVALLMGSLFVGVRRGMGDLAGLVAVVLGPVMVWSLHIRGKYYTEVPLAALCVAAVVALAASEGMRRRAPSLLFGVFLGLGLLTKWSFAFFLGPLAAVSMMHAVWRSVGHPVHRIVGTLGVALVPVFVLGGAAGWVNHGLTVAVWLAVTVAIYLARVSRRSGDGQHRLMNVALMVTAVVAVAGPWYWSNFWSLQEFLTANMSQKFHGDAVAGWLGWPFYPAVFLTRMMGTPAAVICLIGAALSVRRDCPVLVRYSVIALLSGMLILGVLPYRAGRYLIPALGLAVPPMIWVLRRWQRPAKVLLPLCLLGGFLQQTSWIPMAVGGARVPHHLAIFSLPEPDLMGNTKRGIYQAYTDLLRPRWRFLPVANPPIHRTAPSKKLATRIAKDSGSTPSLTVVLDPASALNLNAMQTHMTATRPPPTTAIVRADTPFDSSVLSAWKHRARKPRDQPATAFGPPVPRRLYVVNAYRPDSGPSAAEVDLFRSAGFEAISRDGVVGAFEPVGMTIWRWAP